MTEDATLTPAAGWRETHFERGTYGANDREGLIAGFEREDATVETLPVRYVRRGGQEVVSAVTEEWEAGRNDPGVPRRDVPPLLAFATRLTYTPHEVEREEVLCVADDAGDALAVGLWLAGTATDATDLGRHVSLHAGSGSPTGAGPTLSDDDVLGATFADEPERCVLTGVETSSHVVTLPYRYAPLLSGARRTRAGVPRFPSTVRALEGVVSHEAWTEDELEPVDFDAPIERVEAGRYRLAPPVVGAVAGADAEAFALRRFDE